MELEFILNCLKTPKFLISSGLIIVFASSAFYHKYLRLKKAKKDKIKLKMDEEKRENLKNLSKEYVFTPDRAKIVATPLNELLEKINFKILSATIVLEAFISKLLQESSENFFDSDIEFIPQAMEWVKILDSMEMSKGPLHGIPFFVEDTIEIKGMISKVKNSKNKDVKCENSAAIVKTLRDLGAVPFAKVSTTSNILPSDSIESQNSEDEKLSRINKVSNSLRGVFCIGSSIYSSVTISDTPLGFARLRPTKERITRKGCAQFFIPREYLVESVPLITSPTVASLTTVIRSIFSNSNAFQRNYDANVAPIPWDNEIFNLNEPIRIGICSTSANSLIFEAKEILEMKGNILVPIVLDDEVPNALDELIFSLYDEKRNNFYRNENNVYDYLTYKAPICILSTLTKILKHIPFQNCQKLFLNVMLGILDKKQYEKWELYREKEIMTQQYFDIFDRNNIELIIHDPNSYTKISQKFQDFPVGTISNQILNDSKMKTISLQVVGKKYEDELVLGILNEIEKNIKIKAEK